MEVEGAPCPYTGQNPDPVKSYLDSPESDYHTALNDLGTVQLRVLVLECAKHLGRTSIFDDFLAVRLAVSSLSKRLTLTLSSHRRRCRQGTVACVLVSVASALYEFGGDVVGIFARVTRHIASFSPEAGDI